MSLDSIASARISRWMQACEVWAFDELEPPFGNETLTPSGDTMVIRFRAHRTVVQDGQKLAVTLDVGETWQRGERLDGDRRLEAEGCSVEALVWHVQLLDEAASERSERLEVVPQEDEHHPRIHRHPFGRPDGEKEPAEFELPEVWLAGVDRQLNGGFSDQYDNWDDEGN